MPAAVKLANYNSWAERGNCARAATIANVRCPRFSSCSIWLLSDVKILKRDFSSSDSRGENESLTACNCQPFFALHSSALSLIKVGRKWARLAHRACIVISLTEIAIDLSFLRYCKSFWRRKLLLQSLAKIFPSYLRFYFIRLNQNDWKWIFFIKIFQLAFFYLTFYYCLAKLWSFLWYSCFQLFLSHFWLIFKVWRYFSINCVSYDAPTNSRFITDYTYYTSITIAFFFITKTKVANVKLRVSMKNLSKSTAAIL